MLNFYTKARWFVFIFCGGLLWQSCNVINPAEKTPTYIHIDSFTFKGLANFPNLPTSSQITNVAVYYNNNPVGNFDLPATFPVIANGYGTLEISPGVNIDGLNDLTSVYPFYQTDTFGFTAQPGKILNCAPSTSYYTDITTYKISTFDGNSGFAADGTNIGIVTIFPPNPLAYNGGTGMIKLNAIGDSSVDSSTQSFAIPAGPAYIEFDYYSTVPFFVGLQAQLAGIYSLPFFLAGIAPTVPGKGWQKFYLSVADFNGQYQATSYNFYIKAAMTTQTSGMLLIDNIYLITLPQ